jgi:excisionase family DNA binding protein
MKTAVRKNADMRDIIKASLEHIQKQNEFIAGIITALADMPEPAAPVIIRQPKENMCVKEAAAYCGYKVSYMYALANRNEIPHHKPTGGRIFFKRGELDEFMARGKRNAGYEVQDTANSILNGERGR